MWRNASNGWNNVAEAEAALLAIRASKKLEARKLHVEGDSQVIIKAIVKCDMEAWHLQNFITKINDELASFEDFKLSHIKRQGNKEANIIVEVVIENFLDIIWEE